MHNNKSPWIFELNHDRKIQKMYQDEETDVVIVGAGIAGISSAFFILQNTDKKVVLVEKDRLAHGATGHNAGHVIAYFERPISDIAKEYGIEMAMDGQKAIESGWELLDHMYNTANLSIPFNHLTGHAGYATKEEVFEELEASFLFRENKMDYKEMLISKDTPWLLEIPKKYEGLYKLAEKKEVLDPIESKDDQYVASVPYKVGCVNSARFCEKILEYLLNKYNDRFKFFEETPVNKVILNSDGALLDSERFTVEAKKVILCTNGFEHIEIFNKSLDLDEKFHRNVRGVIGYMSAYIEAASKVPFTAAYFTKDRSIESDPYFYVTRRQYDFEDNSLTNLVCIGGPEINLEDRKEYRRDYEYPEDAQEQIDKFVERTYQENPEKHYKHHFSWHGLMGYTQNNIRFIGEEPKNSTLLYNLGCNGVGILPSVYGGWKIGEIIAGKKFSPSIFDPK